MTPGPIVGIDVGGTFTDVFLLDPGGARLATAKVPTTPADQSIGLGAGLVSVGDSTGARAIVHGTTVGTNTLLERKGARTGLITTTGFRDVLEMRRRDRPRTWGLDAAFAPIVPRDRRLEVDEWTHADGTVLAPVDEDSVRAACVRLRDMGAEALCIAFINAYANDANERAALAVAEAVWSNPHVVASAEVVPEIREFERTSTAVLNAYLRPVMDRYLGALEGRLRAACFGGSVLIVQSSGGMMALDGARRFPVRTALSGPAAGVIAGTRLAVAAGHDDVITCDMGGTSFDVALAEGGEPTTSAETAIDFGLVIRAPMVEVTTIGAGGGSIASVDASGILAVGPESAGADPGPACYGRGARRPTVTDANLVLGRIDVDGPMGGVSHRFDVAAARAALMADVGTPLGLDATAAAEAVIEIANARLAGAIRLVSIERGHDPRRFSAVMFGGGGGLHACALIRDVGLARALVPRFPGVTSALGCVLSEMRHDVVRTINAPLEDASMAALDNALVTLAEGAMAVVRGWGASVVRPRFALDMAYQGQSHTLTVPLSVALRGDTTGIDRPQIAAAFDARYRAYAGRLLPGHPIRVVNLRVTATADAPTVDFETFAPPAGLRLEDASRGTRETWAGGAARETPVYDRLSLPRGARIRGPAVLEQPDATIYVDPGFLAAVDPFGNIILTAE